MAYFFCWSGLVHSEIESHEFQHVEKKQSNEEFKRAREELLNQIKKQQEEYSNGKNRRKKFANSETMNREGEVSRYFTGIQKKIFETGLQIVNEQTERFDLHIRATVSLEIDKEGALLNIIFNKVEGNDQSKALLTEIIAKSAPFKEFPDSEFFDNTDFVVITRYFQLGGQNPHKGKQD